MEVDCDQQTVSEVQIGNFDKIPKPVWNLDRKIVPEPWQLPINSKGDSKASLFIDRYNLILQRLKRSPLFSGSKEGFQLTTTDSLIGSHGKKFLFGMITQFEEGKYHLEDPKGTVALDLSKSQYSSGLFCEGCFVIVSGEYKQASSELEVEVLGMPPAETRDSSKQYLQNLELFISRESGSSSGTNGKYSMFKVSDQQGFKVIPSEAEMVILSDVHLDDSKVLEKLRTMLSEFGLDPPVAFIFLGNFTSQQGSLEDSVSRMKIGMEKLTDMLLSFPSIIQNSELIFIPGPSDPGNMTVNILPKLSLPKTFVEYLQQKIPKVHLANNPCRIRYYGHDLVFFRDDLVHKMRRHCIIQPQLLDTETPELTQHLVKTLLDQSHLCPLPLHIQPVYWNFDHHLSLFPSPDVLILADKFQQYEHNYESCLCFNPGSFAVDYSFVTYRPSTKQTGFSRVED